MSVRSSCHFLRARIGLVSRRATFSQRLRLSTTPSAMAAPTTTAGQIISETTREQGGPKQGSTAAQMQSSVGKTQNFETAAQSVGEKMQSHPEQVTAADANYLKSREARALGQKQPPRDSISAEAQRLASANEQGNVPTSYSGTGPLSPEEQSRLTKEKNFEDAVASVGEKMVSNPQSVSKADGDLLHSREQRARGTTEKGGIASQAQSLANENERKGMA